MNAVKLQKDSAVLELLYTNFFINHPREYFDAYINESFAIPSEHLRASSEKRASDIYAIFENNNVIAFGMNKYYKVTEIAPQLYFKLIFIDDTCFISLISFEKLLNLSLSNSNSLVAEMAYSWVAPHYRNGCLYKYLVNYRLREISSILRKDECIFVLFKAIENYSTIGRSLKQALINSPTKAVDITQLGLGLQEINELIRQIPPFFTSNLGFSFKGLFTNFSRMYTKSL